jgi:hypothetical protein
MWAPGKLVWNRHSCPLLLTSTLTLESTNSVIPTGAGVPATAERRNLLFVFPRMSVWNGNHGPLLLALS